MIRERSPLDQNIELQQMLLMVVARQAIRMSTDFEMPPVPKSVDDLVYHRKQWTSACDFLDIDMLYPYTGENIDFKEALSRCSSTFYGFVKADMLRRHGAYSFPGRLDNDPYRDLFNVNDPTSRGLVTNLSSLGPSAFIGIDLNRKWVSPSAETLLLRSQRLSEWAGCRFAKMPWFDGNIGVILGGGFVATAMMGHTTYSNNTCIPRLPGSSDIDIFMCTTQRASAARASAARDSNALFDDARDDLVRRIVDAVRDAENDQVVDVAFKESANALTLFVTERVTGSAHRVSKVQIILRVFETPSHAMHGFDLATSKFLYNGSDVMGTEAALYAMHTGVELFDETKLSTSAHVRYAKYAKRFGLHILVPGISQDLLDLLECRVVWDEGLKLDLGSMVAKLQCRLTDRILSVLVPDVPLSDYDEYLWKPTLPIARRNGLASIEQLNIKLLCLDDSRTNDYRKKFTGALNPVKKSNFAEIERDLVKLLE
eukprot:gene29492-5838_t